MQLRGKVYKTHGKAGKDVGSCTHSHSNHTLQTIREEQQAFKLVWIRVFIKASTIRVKHLRWVFIPLLSIEDLPKVLKDHRDGL